MVHLRMIIVISYQPSYAIYYDAICTKHGATTYDFGGTDNDQTKIQNIMDCGHSNVYGAYLSEK